MRKHIFEVEMLKTHHVPTIFGSWDVEKVRAVVARSTFRSKNVQTPSGPEHFWQLRCAKNNARRCGTKHIFQPHHTTLTPPPPPQQQQQELLLLLLLLLLQLQHLQHLHLHLYTYTYTTFTTLHCIALHCTKLHYTFYTTLRYNYT